MSAVLIALLWAAQTFDGAGPHPVESALDQSLAIPSGAIEADLYWPAGVSSAVPIVVVGHGFARTKAAVTNWGTHLASHGLVVVVPSFPGPFMPDHAANALRMRELITFVRATPGPVGATIDSNRSAVVGHSAGGLSALLAAADDPSISVVVGLDPVDAMGMAAARAGAIGQPVLVLGAEAAMCNSNGSAGTLYPALTSAGSWFLRVVGSTHCDGEDPSNGTCTAFCGGEDAARRALYRRYATAHLVGWLTCAGNDYLPGGSGLMSDLSGGSVADFAELPGAPCGAPPADAGVIMDAANEDAGAEPDAGEPEPDARANEDAAAEPDAGENEVDAGENARDAGVSSDAGASSNPGSATRDESSCGCTATHDHHGLELFWLLALTPIFLRARRRAAADSASKDRAPPPSRAPRSPRRDRRA